MEDLTAARPDTKYYKKVRKNMNAVKAEMLEKKCTQLYRILEEELARGAKRLDYNELAKRLDCARSTIRYNVGKLMDAGVIGIRGGRLYLK